MATRKVTPERALLDMAVSAVGALVSEGCKDLDECERAEQVAMAQEDMVVVLTPIAEKVGEVRAIKKRLGYIISAVQSASEKYRKP